jgi:membrane protease YdiL (CAAX protease family)
LKELCLFSNVGPQQKLLTQGWMKLIKEASCVEKTNTVSPSMAILVVVVTFVLALFLETAIFLLSGFGPALILGELLIMIVPLSYLLSKHVDIKAYIGLNIKSKVILVGVASGALLFVLDVAGVAVLTSVLGVSQAVEESNAMITDLSSSTPGLISVIVALSLTGFCEEFLFRGFLQNTINRKYGFAPAVLISSVAFGLFHFDPQFVYIFGTILLGLVLGYIYHRWNSYVVSAVAHSTLNLIVLALLLLAI